MFSVYQKLSCLSRAPDAAQIVCGRFARRDNWTCGSPNVAIQPKRPLYKATQRVYEVICKVGWGRAAPELSEIPDPCIWPILGWLSA